MLRVTLLSTSVKSYLQCQRLRMRRNKVMKERTETKKLEVPSDRSNVAGNNFNQVSSPNMSSLPFPAARI